MRHNKLCECPLAGYCNRHGVHKHAREHQLCRGVNCTAQQSAKYWNTWEAGTMPGQTGAPVSEPKDFDSQAQRAGNVSVRRGLGDWVSHQITRFTGIKPCGGCKDRAAWLNHFFAADLPQIEHVELSNPVRHLMFHVWPVKARGAWRWHCDRLLQHAPLFNGRRIVAIVTDGTTDDAEAVKSYLSGFTEEFLTFPNDSRLREVVSWAPMLERLERYQSDQDVTFSCHAKGLRHNVTPDSTGSTLFRWSGAMYEVLLTRIEQVQSALETKAVVGIFRRFGAPQHGGWGLWHYSGTFFWFRNRDAFRRNWRYVPQRFYGTEAWPGLMFSPDESACLIGDQVQDLYNLTYWQQQIEPQLEAWRAAQSANNLSR